MHFAWSGGSAGFDSICRDGARFIKTFRVRVRVRFANNFRVGSVRLKTQSSCDFSSGSVPNRKSRGGVLIGMQKGGRVCQSPLREL